MTSSDVSLATFASASDRRYSRDPRNPLAITASLRDQAKQPARLSADLSLRVQCLCSRERVLGQGCIPCLHRHEPETEPDALELRRERCTALQDVDTVRRASDIVQGEPKVIVCLGVTRLELEHAAVDWDRLLESARDKQTVCRITQGAGVSRVDIDLKLGRFATDRAAHPLLQRCVLGSGDRLSGSCCPELRLRWVAQIVVARHSKDRKPIEGEQNDEHDPLQE